MHKMEFLEQWIKIIMTLNNEAYALIILNKI